MSSITTIITAYRRPDNIRPLVDAIRRQSVPPASVWAWANDPSAKMTAVLAKAKLDRVVTSSDNARFHGRFALALLAQTEFVAIFDDDSIPGEDWFENCLETMVRTPGILGTAGVVLHEPGYGKRTMHGWQRPSDKTAEVDLVGQAWFLRTEWIKHLFSGPPVTGTNGEDIELAARAWRLAGIRSYCPPHPPGKPERWGSTRGLELGLDDVAASLRVEHLAERKRIVDAEMAAGWKPLFMRKEGSGFGIQGSAEGTGNREQGTEISVGNALRGVPTVSAAAPPVAVTACQEGECVDIGDELERVRDPLAFLRALRPSLKHGQRLVGSVANSRHEAIVRDLLHGRWQNGQPDRLRYFTRREIEKLFYRAGFGSPAISPSPPHSLCPSRSPLANSLNEEDAREFNVERYDVTATAEPQRYYGLTSIVIVTHSEIPYTRACLESIRFLTDEPYELIVVDNGSTDGTVDYVRSCPDVKLIENDNNRGFPAAANQGIRASEGSQVLLLNNDVLVTTSWLDRLLTPLRNDKTIGLVGPLTSCASGYQEIGVPYTDLAALDGFAWEHAKAHTGQLLEVDRLIGFCLLIRREVIDQIGLLDERFGIGNFEDDDYCRRARDAGWQCVVAQDAFIHHFGHRTFDAAGVDLNSLLIRNRQIFDEKWAEPSPKSEVQSPKLSDSSLGAHSSSLHSSSPSLAPSVSPSPSCPSLISDPSSVILSLCMIVRNNAGTIRPCLESIKPWVDEMIVVDTGSTDATPDICRELGAQVYHFPWPDSFAIARNESLKYAKGKWVFWMDSDDVIDAENGRKLRELAYRQHDPKTLGYVMQVHCPGNGPDGIHDVTVVDHVKLFRNRPDLRFDGRIHEQVIDAINRAGGDIVFTAVFVVHAGADHSVEGRKRKLKRDVRLLRLDRRERPNHTFVEFNLGMTYADAGKHRKAIKSLRRSLELAQPHESHVRKIYALLVSSYRELGEKAEARRACADGLNLYPKDPELLFRNAMLSHEDGRLRAAEQSYLAALANNDGLHFSSIDRGIVGFKARHNLAAVYTDMGALHKAEAEWRRIVDEVPSYREGWRGLIENLICQKRSHEALESINCLLDGERRLRGLGLTLAARIAESSAQIDRALETLRQARRECPDDVAPLDELCRILFYRGEPSEAEDALRELVRLQPENARAHHNLGTVLLRSGRCQEAADAFRKSLRERGDSAVTQLSLGYALSNAGRRAEAGAAFEQCVRLSAEPRLVAEAQRQLAALAA